MVFIPSSHVDDPDRVQRSMWAPATGSLDLQLDAVARRDARIWELNAPLTPLQADAVPEAPVAKITETARAVDWPAKVLHGPVSQKTVEAMAVKAGIGAKLIRR